MRIFIPSGLDVVQALNAATRAALRKLPQRKQGTATVPSAGLAVAFDAPQFLEVPSVVVKEKAATGLVDNADLTLSVITVDGFTISNASGGDLDVVWFADALAGLR